MEKGKTGTIVSGHGVPLNIGLKRGNPLTVNINTGNSVDMVLSEEV